MRWNDLFSDLEGQLAAAEAQAFASEVSELTKAERAAVELAARVVASRGKPVAVTVRGGVTWHGTIADATGQWLLLDASPREHVIPLAAVIAVTGLIGKSAPLTEVQQRLTLGHALRALARERREVTVAADGVQVRGVISAVGADHLDVTPAGSSAVTMPIAAVTAVTSA